MEVVGINIYIDGVKHNKTPRRFDKLDYHIDDIKSVGETFDVQFSYAYLDRSESELTPIQNRTLSPIGTDTFNFNQDVVFVFVGNSLVKGTRDLTNPIEQHFPNYVKDYFTGKFNSVEFYSYGSDGNTIPTMLINAPTESYDKSVVGKSNFIFFFEDVNTLYQGIYNAEQQWIKTKEYFDNCRTNGFDYLVLITGYHLRQESYSPEVEMQRKIYLERVISTPLVDSPWDYHIDLNEAPHIGGKKWLPRNEYFIDHIHLTGSGYDIIGEQVIKEILDIIKQ